MHLLSGVAVLADHRRRVPSHHPTTTAVVARTALTGVTVSAAAFRFAAKLGETRNYAQDGAAAGQKAGILATRMKWLQQWSALPRLDSWS